MSCSLPLLALVNIYVYARKSSLSLLDVFEPGPLSTCPGRSSRVRSRLLLPHHLTCPPPLHREEPDLDLTCPPLRQEEPDLDLTYPPPLRREEPDLHLLCSVDSFRILQHSSRSNDSGSGSGSGFLSLCSTPQVRKSLLVCSGVFQANGYYPKLRRGCGRVRKSTRREGN